MFNRPKALYKNLMFSSIRRKKMIKVLKAIFLIPIGVMTCIFLLSACKPHVIVTETPHETFSMDKLVVLPIKNMAGIYGENVAALCPICGKVFLTGNVAQGADNILTQHLISILRKREDFKLIPASQAQGVLSSLLSESKAVMPERDMVVRIGDSLDADAVMVGYVYRFSRRVGTWYSVDSPASVAFGVHLVSVASGRIIWSGHFDETQQSLSENLFQLGTFIKRKASWVTAQEIAVSALEDMFESFNP